MRDLRRTGRSEHEDLRAVADAPGVELQRLVPVVAVSRHPGADPGPDQRPGDRGVHVDRLWAALRQPSLRQAEVGVALGVALVVASGDSKVGVAGAALVAAAALVRFIDRHVSFSFGEGFVGYRGDPVWPQGVQEDDDVRWDWRPSTAERSASRSKVVL
jgi:hypothetical protein